MASEKVVKMKRTGNTAKVLFAIFILYILIFGIITFSKKAEKTYEVHAGSLAADQTYTGFIIRDEMVVNSAYAGNLNYYVRESTRVKKDDIIYTVDETGRVAALLEEINNGDNSLASDDVADIKDMLSMYKTEYDRNNFYQVYDLKVNIDSTVLRATNQALVNNLDALIEKTGSSALFQMVSTDRTGIVQYTIDGYEDVTIDSFQEEMLNGSNYKSQNLYMQDVTVKGSPVYRLITDETWQIVFKLTAEEIDKYQLNNKTSVTVNFKKNKIRVAAGFSIINRDGAYYGVLELKDYMLRFASDRYVDFEISTSSYEGLKLPVSAITEQNFFVVPIDYITTGGNSTDEGFLCEYYNESGGKVTEFKKAKIYYRDDKYCYVHTDSLSSGYVLLRTGSQDTYTVGEKKPLTGVFCVNTGYTVFRRIEVVEQGKEYCVAKKGISYGISLYDRILLDAEGKTEGEMIY